jgi:hypothetical protein
MVYTMKNKISLIDKSIVSFPVKMSRESVKLCRLHSDKFPHCPRKTKGSTAHFLKQAAIEKLLKLGLKKSYLESIT